MLQDDDQQGQVESSQSSLPSIRQLFGIKASDNLDALISPNTPQRPHRNANNPPPSAFPHQAINAVNTSPRPSLSLERRLDTRTPVRSASFSSGQVGQHSSARGRLMSPRSASSSSVSPYAPLPPQLHQTTSRSPTFSRSRHSPSTHTSTVALPPISTAIPGFIPANRGRAASDTETFGRGGLGLTAGRIITLSSQPAAAASPRESAPIHPSLHPRHSADPATIDQRGHVGRSPVQATTSDAHFASSGRSHAHSISSAHSDEPAPSHAAWTDRSRSSLEYSQTSSSQEYAPHPYSSASISTRQKTGYPSVPITSTSAPTGSNYTSEGSTQASPSRGGVERHVPPSSFPHYSVYSSANRPKSGNSSEGDESKGGFGKYECEYCSKRFNRPSSLRIHINTHTGAKPFQCPFPSCGRRFSVMSNMRRHARTHGNMLSSSTGEDPHSHPRGSGDSAQGSTSVSLNGHHHHEYHVERRSSFVDSTGKSIKTDVDAEMEVEMDELEGDDEDDSMYDGGAGSSESESYHRGHLPGRRSSSDQSHNFHGY